MPNCTGIFQAYGMTETSLAATKDNSNEGFERKPGSGGYPIPGVKVKVTNERSIHVPITCTCYILDDGKWPTINSHSAT